MHKLILWIFENINNIAQTLTLICSFFIMTTLFYWLEILTNSQWNWLNLIKPVLDIILNFSNSILPFSISAFGTVFDGKFITTIIFLMCLIIVIRLFVNGLDNLKYLYDDMHNIHKKNIENNFNKQMKNKVLVSEIKISKYMVLINAQLKKKFNHEELKIDINEHINKLNNFLYKQTGVKFEQYNDGFLYNFENFNKIDDVLDLLFKLLKSQSPLDLAICIQTEWDKTKINRLSDLKYFGKIIFCADTLLRYKCNTSHRYGTKNVGIFQQDDESTIEVHEFHEIL